MEAGLLGLVPTTCGLLKLIQRTLQTMLKSHVVVRTQPQTGTHHIHNRTTLREQCIHNGSPIRNKRGLQHIRKKRQDRVEGLPLVITRLLHADALTELPENHQIVNQWCGQKRILTCIVHHNRVLSTHEDLRSVLIHRTLRVCHIWHILDHHNMIGMFILFKQNTVRSNHIIHNIRLGDLLASELTRSRQVLSIIVSQMIV
mmetsp:Transcript_22684/g.52428  ORF Transcript_22684/g.52428 Transcript_22684/m.52428 type:complete len:201 (+) Transcript_22684:1659-2261(+)